jgi:hypothetical protein
MRFLKFILLAGVISAIHYYNHKDDAKNMAEEAYRNVKVQVPKIDYKFHTETAVARQSFQDSLSVQPIVLPNDGE